MNPNDLLSDEELVARAQRHPQGNQYEDALLKRYNAPLFSIANTFRIAGVLVEDRHSECVIAFLRAIRTFEADAGAKFKTYKERLVWNHLRSVARRHTGSTRVPIASLVSLEDEKPGAEMTWEECTPTDEDTIAEILADEASAENEAELLAVAEAVSEKAKLLNGMTTVRRCLLTIGYQVLTDEAFSDLTTMLVFRSNQPGLFAESEDGEGALCWVVEEFHRIRAGIAEMVGDGYALEDIIESSPLDRAGVMAVRDLILSLREHKDDLLALELAA